MNAFFLTRHDSQTTTKLLNQRLYGKAKDMKAWHNCHHCANATIGFVEQRQLSIHCKFQAVLDQQLAHKGLYIE